MTTTHPNVELVVAALRRGGADPDRIARMRVLPGAVTTAAAAAAALGVQVGQIANSLVFRTVAADGTQAPLLVLTSGAHRVDTGRVAQLLGVQRVARASAEFVRAVTGQVIGGVAPVGHPAPLRTLVDRELAGYEEVWAAGGIPHAVVPLTYAELVKVTGGEPADVA
jgi:prolyl-tRNA editing enzyme YbaK/EbsC (Cys-tRNA(Pro) deacylase)